MISTGLVEGMSLTGVSGEPYLNAKPHNLAEENIKRIKKSEKDV